MKTMIPLRLIGIASNVAFMSYALLGLQYGVFGQLYPILFLHAGLLPLNVIRLRQVRRLVHAVGAGAVLGEVGLFAAGGTRSLSARCEGDCRVWTITKEKTLELYDQNPKFGMFLIRLVSGYALHHAIPKSAG
jgi:CRP-like cAMP-binding protein